MKIAIDISRAVNETAGVGRYTRELVLSLQKPLKDDELILLANFFNHRAKKTQIVRQIAGQSKTIVTHYPGKIKEFLLQSKWHFQSFLNKRADVFLAPTFLDVNYSLKIPQIVVIHDLSMFLFPEHLGEKQAKKYQILTKKACQKAVKVIAVSESTKNDLVRLAGIEPAKIEVIYPGQTILPEPASSLPFDLKAKSYILNVGTLEPRKNLVGLMEAYADLPSDLQEKYPLVVVGAKGWNTSEVFLKYQEYGLEGKVIFAGYLSDKELSALYRDAAIFVYPSLYEGFGLPVLEAMSYGLPVLTSNLSSLPEVIGSAGIQIDPTDEKALQEGIQRLLEDNQAAASLGQKALERSKQFTWEKTGLNVLKTIKNVIVK